MENWILQEKDMEAYLKALRLRERSDATLKRYARTLRDFYAWLPAGKMVGKETAMNYKSVLTQRYSPSGANAAISSLNGFFSFMGRQECRVAALKIQRRVFSCKDKELTRKEYEQLVAAAEARGNEKLSLLLQLMAATGLRAGEVASITYEAVEDGKAEIHLKGKIRTILLPGKLCRKLLKYARRQTILSGSLFRTRTGRAMNRKEIWWQMKRLCAAAGVEPGKVFPHNLRHLFARLFYRAQKDIVKLADLLGHSRVETTRIYLISSGDEHRKALESLRLVC